MYNNIHTYIQWSIRRKGKGKEKRRGGEDEQGIRKLGAIIRSPSTFQTQEPRDFLGQLSKDSGNSITIDL